MLLQSEFKRNSLKVSREKLEKLSQLQGVYNWSEMQCTQVATRGHPMPSVQQSSICTIRPIGEKTKQAIYIYIYEAILICLQKYAVKKNSETKYHRPCVRKLFYP